MLGIYIRKSRNKKKEKSLKEQELLGTEFADNLGMSFRIFNEGVISGQKGTEERPEFGKLLTAIEQKKLEGVYIWDSSRIARNELAFGKFQVLLRDSGVLLYDNGVKADMRDENTFLFYHMKSGFDAHFAKLTSQKIRTVLKRNAQNGLVHGRPPIGYTKDNKGQILIDPEQSKLVKRIYKMSLEGRGSKVIANMLTEEGVPTMRKKQVWAANTVLDIIKNPYYKGERHFSGKVYEVPAIFKPSYWQKVNDNLQKNRIYSGKGVEHKYLLNKGLLKCGKCSKNYFGRKNSNIKYGYYICASRKSRLEDCNNRAIPINVLETFVWERFFKSKELFSLVKEHLKDNGNAENTKVIKDEIKVLESKNIKLSKERQNLITAVRKGAFIDSDIKADKESIDRETNDNLTIINNLSEQLQSYSNSERKLREINNDFEHLKTKTSFNDKKKIITKYLEQIVITYDRHSKHNLGWFELVVYFNVPDMKPETYLLDSKYQIAIRKDKAYASIKLDGVAVYSTNDTVYFYDAENNRYDVFPIPDNEYYEKLHKEMIYNELGGE